MKRAPTARRGFTLIELLVVIAIIAVIIGMLLPAIQKVREAAANSQCKNHLKQIGVALHNYHNVYGALPPSRLDNRYTWMVSILPYVEQENLYTAWNLNAAFDKQSQAARETPVKIYFCPSRRSADNASVSVDVMDGTTTAANGVVADYAACVGDPSNGAGNDYWFTDYQGAANTPNNGVFRLANDWSAAGGPNRPGVRFQEITDGQSNTIAVGEKHVQLGQFGQVAAGDGPAYNGDKGYSFRALGPGRTIVRNPSSGGAGNFGSYHGEMCNFVFCDGSVRGIRASLDATTLGRLASRNDGQVISSID